MRTIIGAELPPDGVSSILTTEVDAGNDAVVTELVVAPIEEVWDTVEPVVMRVVVVRLGEMRDPGERVVATARGCVVVAKIPVPVVVA